MELELEIEKPMPQDKDEDDCEDDSRGVYVVDYSFNKSNSSDSIIKDILESK